MLNRANRETEDPSDSQESAPKMLSEVRVSKNKKPLKGKKRTFLKKPRLEKSSGSKTLLVEDRHAEKSKDRHSSKRWFRLKLVVASLFLMLMSLAFGALFNITSLEKLYLKSFLSPYRIIAEDLKENVELGISYGKQVSNFYNIEKYLSETHQAALSLNHLHSFMDEPNGNFNQSKYSVSVSLVFPNGRVIKSTHAPLENRQLPIGLDKIHSETKDSPSDSIIGKYIETPDNYLVPVSVKDAQKNQTAAIVIGIEKQLIQTVQNKILERNLNLLGIVAGTGFFLFIVVLPLMIPKQYDIKRFPKRKIFGFLILSVCSVQIIYAALSLNTYKNYQFQNNQQKSQLAMLLLRDDIEFLLDLNLKWEKLRGLDAWIRQKIQLFPELNSVWILDSHEQPYFMITHQSAFNTIGYPSDPLTVIELPILFSQEGYIGKGNLEKDGEVKGFILTQMASRKVFAGLWEITLDVMTIIVICTLIFIELLILVLYSLDQKPVEKEPQFKIHYGIMRPAAFFFLVGIDISISFIPLHAQQIYTPLFGLSKDTLIGLPISVEFLFVGFSIFIAGIWNDKRGWHEPFLCGLLLAGTGEIYSWWAPDILHFIVSRAFVGTGYGFLLLAAQGFVIAYSGENSKAQALAQFIAGLYAGSICGGAIGGIMAERIGYRTVFLIGAVILYGILGYVLVFMRNAMTSPHSDSCPSRSLISEKIGIADFLKNRIVLSLIFLSSMPASIAVVGFLNYFIPIYLNRIEVSQGTIGRVLMIYGVSLIYIGPIISRHVDASQNKRYFIFAGCIIGSLTFLSFYIFSGLLAAVMAVFLLGFSSSLIIASQSAYLLNLTVTRYLGAGKAIGIFRASSRIGQAVGPIVFSILIMGADIEQGITHMGILYLITAILFLLLTFKDKTCRRFSQ